MLRVIFLLSLASALKLNTEERKEPHKSETQFEEESKKPKIASRSEFGEGCSDKAKPKVAVLFFGMARSFDDEKEQTSWAKHVFEPLASKGTQGIANPTKAADIFVHIKTGNRPVDEVNAAMKKWNPVKYTVVEGQGMYGGFPAGPPSSKLVTNPTCWKNFKNILGNCMGRDWSIQEAHKLMEEYENSVNQQYDVVLVSRADLTIREAIDTSEFQCVNGQMHRDFYVTIPRKHSHLMRNILADFYLNEQPHGCGKMASCEDVWVQATNLWRGVNASVSWTNSIGIGLPDQHHDYVPTQQWSKQD